MAKVITVWGNAGSGKSVFCCILARALATDNSKVIILSADSAIPMYPVWLPLQEIDAGMSIGQLYTANDIDTAIVASKVTVLKDHSNIGLIGHIKGETPLSYPEIKYDLAQRLIATTCKLVDYVIIDLSSTLTNFFAPAAIESASVVARLLTTDPRGSSYFNAHKPLLLDPRFRLDEHLTFAALYRPFHATDEVVKNVGKLSGMLPYIGRIEHCAIEDKIFEAISQCNDKYMASIKTVLEAVRGEQFE